MSRFVLDSNNLWLMANSDGTIQVLDGPYEPDLNTNDVRGDVTNWDQMARIGTNSNSTHQELEVFEVVFSGEKLEALRKDISRHQVIVNREGFMVQWINPGGGGGDKGPADADLYRRLNDLFDWSKYEVEVPTPLQTEWDRYQLTTGKLMVEGTGRGLYLQQIHLEELETENQTLRDEKDKEIEELKKQIDEIRVAGGNEKEMELKKQLAAKDKLIGILRHALRLFL